MSNIEDERGEEGRRRKGGEKGRGEREGRKGGEKKMVDTIAGVSLAKRVSNSLEREFRTVGREKLIHEVKKGRKGEGERRRERGGKYSSKDQ
jgi:hypothetical protein